MKFPIDLNRATPSQGQFNPIQAQVPDLTAPMQATQQLGQTIQKGAHELGAAVEQFKIRQDKFNYTVARSKFIQDSVNLQNEIENDSDYINSPAKYQEKMAELKQKHVESLGSNKFAPLFKSEMNIYEAKSLADINKSTSDKLFYSQQAQANQVLEDNLNAFTKTKDPVAQQALIHGSIEAYADSIPDNDPKKPLLIQEYKQNTGKRFAETALVSMSPSQQIAVLNQENKKGGSTIATFLPADQRQDWLQKAELLKEKQDQAAIRQVERADKQNKLNRDKVMLQGIQQGLSFDQLPLELKLKASKEDIDRYENLRLQQLEVGSDQTLDREKEYQNFRDLYVKDPKKFANMSLSEMAAKVPLSKINEVEKWHEQAFNGAIAPADLNNKVQIINDAVSSIGLDTDQKVKFKTRFDEDVESWKQANKKDPSKKDLEDIANNLVVEKAFETKGIFGTSVDKARGYKVPKDASIAVPDKVIEEIQTQARLKGNRIPSEEEVKTWYQNKNK